MFAKSLHFAQVDIFHTGFNSSGINIILHEPGFRLKIIPDPYLNFASAGRSFPVYLAPARWNRTFVPTVILFIVFCISVTSDIETIFDWLLFSDPISPYIIEHCSCINMPVSLSHGNDIHKVRVPVGSKCNSSYPFMIYWCILGSIFRISRVYANRVNWIPVRYYCISFDYLSLTILFWNIRSIYTPYSGSQGRSAIKQFTVSAYINFSYHTGIWINCV